MTNDDGSPDVLLLDRIRQRVGVDEHGCWLWTGWLTRGGYAQTSWKGRAAYVHRLTYHYLRDPSVPIWPEPDGDRLDHRCRNRRCCNPAHLELVGNRRNIVRGEPGVLGHHVSRFVGVSWSASESRWQAQARLNGRKVFLGRFDTERHAYEAYVRFVDEHDPEAGAEVRRLCAPTRRPSALRPRRADITPS